VHTSLIPPLFGAWPRGSVEMPFQRLSHQPLRMYHIHTHKLTSTALQKPVHVRWRSFNCSDFNLCQEMLTCRCASAPQGRSRRISPINTCIHRDPPGSLSFGPRRNDRAEWTTTRHIDLTLFHLVSDVLPFPSWRLLASSLLSFLAL
jgi:hypothetical protein